MTGVFTTFCILRCMDMLSTMALFTNNRHEGNLVLLAIMRLGNPLVMLTAANAFAIVCAALLLRYYAYGERVVRRLNWIFSAIVIWNLINLVIV